MSESQAIAAAPPELGTAAVDLLRELISINTVNPPGNEGPAQKVLADLLSPAGFDCQMLSRDPDRPNLVARLRGEAEGPTLALICHVDTVSADPEEWTHDPWSGDVADGHVWGRGALDMKDQVAAEAVACAALGRSGWRPARGDLLLICAADEEAGAHYGAKWLCEERPEEVRCDYVVNEGAGMALDFGGRRFYTLAVGEKGVFRFHLRTLGTAGHASLPNVGDNALLKMAPLLERLRFQPAREATADTRAFLNLLLDDEVEARPGALDAALGRIREEDPLLADLLAEPMLGVTLTPTKARASDKDNVVPSRAEVLVDCRVPPELGEEVVRERIASVLDGDGGPDYEVDFVERVVGNRSDFAGPLADAVGAWIADVDPGAVPLPIVMPGFSDSHWFRKAFGATVYGFCPQSAMSLAEATPLVHGADERVAVEDVELGARFFWDLPQRMLG